MLFDLKYAFRQIRKNYGFTIVTVLILGLGIASNSSVFSAVQALLLRGLPVHDPEQLVLVTKSGAKNPIAAGDREIFQYADYLQFRDHTKSLTGIAAIRRFDLALVASNLGRTDVIPIRADEVSGSFFSVIGIPAYAGRMLTPEDDKKGAPHAVAVISYALWQRQFGGDASVVGKTVVLNNTSVAIVGIAPPEFYGVEISARADLWTPIQLLAILEPDSNWQKLETADVRMIGRLRPRVEWESARAEMDVLFQARLAERRITPMFRSQYFGNISLLPGGSGFSNVGRQQARQLTSVLMIVVALVLAIACANVAGLLLARTMVRQREFALRAALGAGRGLLIRQLLTESLILAMCGGAIGILLSYWGIHVLANCLPGGGTLKMSLDGSVLVFTILISIGSGILIGLVPALRFSRIDLISDLKEQAINLTHGSRQGINQVLVIAQTALSVSLLLGTGLFVHSLKNLKDIDLGFHRENLLLVNIGIDKNYDANRKVNLIKDITAGLEALPGTRSATVSIGGLLGTTNLSSSNLFQVDGYMPKLNENMSANFCFVGSKYFETVGTPLLQGRDFNAAEIFSAADSTQNAVGVVVINEAIARRCFGRSNALGHYLRLGGGKQVFAIIGVTQDAKYFSLREAAYPEIFFPITKFNSKFPQMSFQLRTTGGLANPASGISAVIHRIDPKLRIINIRAMDDVVAGNLAPERMIVQSAACFSAFALTLASLGLYGVLTYNVARRQREIGIRMALGAHRSNILTLIVKQGMTLALTGCVVGIGAGIMLSRLFAQGLYGVPAIDSSTIFGSALLLILTALLACGLPAYRATKVDPIVALRTE